MSSERFVTVTKEERVGIVSLERPDALNAISGALAEELARVLRAVAADDSLWAIVLTGAGERAFCAGADLKERASFSLADYHHNRTQMRTMFEALRALPQPSIAAIFGYAFGGGLELALSCDLVVASTDSKLALPEVRVGLIPAGGGTQQLARRVGVGRAKELTFTGAQVSAVEALDIGLVDRVVARTELGATALDLARDICASSPVAVRAAKQTMNATLGGSLGPGIDVEEAAWALVVSSRDRVEGIRSFNERRAPRWTNR
jgi:enoyl-CoA hydratase/carnithine racemase